MKSTTAYLIQDTQLGFIHANDISLSQNTDLFSHLHNNPNPDFLTFFKFTIICPHIFPGSCTYGPAQGTSSHHLTPCTFFKVTALPRSQLGNDPRPSEPGSWETLTRLLLQLHSAPSFPKTDFLCYLTHLPFLTKKLH